jgi:hypothetical protein
MAIGSAMGESAIFEAEPRVMHAIMHALVNVVFASRDTAKWGDQSAGSGLSPVRDSLLRQGNSILIS